MSRSDIAAFDRISNQARKYRDKSPPRHKSSPGGGLTESRVIARRVVFNFCDMSGNTNFVNSSGGINAREINNMSGSIIESSRGGFVISLYNVASR